MRFATRFNKNSSLWKEGALKRDLIEVEYLEKRMVGLSYRIRELSKLRIAILDKCRKRVYKRNKKLTNKL